jgi:hypothetical protein
MLTRRRTWLERISNWGVAIAVPLVAIGGFRLLAHARDPAAPVAGAPAAQPPAAAARLLAPPVDASAPPVVELRPRAGAAGEGSGHTSPAAQGEDPGCAALDRKVARLADDARHAPDERAALQLRERSEAARAAARARHCRTH